VVKIERASRHRFEIEFLAHTPRTGARKTRASRYGRLPR
jgi:hypothetical protein